MQIRLVGAVCCAVAGTAATRPAPFNPVTLDFETDGFGNSLAAGQIIEDVEVTGLGDAPEVRRRRIRARAHMRGRVGYD